MLRCKSCDAELTYADNTHCLRLATHSIPQPPDSKWTIYHNPGDAMNEAFSGLYFCRVECLGEWVNKWTEEHKRRREYYRQGREARMRLISVIKSRAA